MGRPPEGLACETDGGGTIRFPRRLFGLTVASELDLPLPAAGGDVAVEVARGPVTATGDLLWRADLPDPFACFRRGEAVVLAWPGLRFGVTADRVVVDARDRAAAIRLLLHPVWSVVLAARGREALHGCVVERAGRAVAIQGLSGTGKTTAGLALLERGWRLVTDDLIAVDDAGTVVPGPPFVRLAPDVAAGRPGPVEPDGKVRFSPATCPGPVPLAVMVVLTEEADRITRLRGAAAVDALLTQVYNPIVTHSGQARRRFELALGLATRVPIYAAPARSLAADALEGLVEEGIA